jgi:hypothetical protein
MTSGYVICPRTKKLFWKINFPRLPLVPIVSASPIYGVPRFCCTGGLSEGVLGDLVPQVISVPYDPSSVEYEVKPNVNEILRNRVKQEGVHRNASHAENNRPNVPVVPEALPYVCPKIEDSQARKQKESF